MQQLTEFTAFLNRQQIEHSLQEPLGRHTTFQIGGPAAVFCQPASPLQLAALLNECRRCGVRFYLLGRGSNVLFSDRGFDGVVIATGHAADDIRISGTNLFAGAGVPLSRLCAEAQKSGLAGLEFAYGIPGSVGGAVYMNAGAYGGEMKNVLVSVSYLDADGRMQSIEAGQAQLAYRTSIFEKKTWCILEAQLALTPGEPEQIKARMEELMERRRQKQPLEYPSAGSTFKRPQGAFAAALIEQCGLKGLQVGGARVSEKHSGFVVNVGGATCEDVLELTRQVSERVYAQTGYRLEREIRVVE